MPKLNPLHKRYLENGILHKWHDKTWKDFTNDKAAKARIRRCLDRHEEMRKDGVGGFLYGDNGTGKTLCMNLVFMELMALGYTVRIMSLSSLITKFTASWYDTVEKRDFQRMLQRVDFLGIEEIGKEFKAGANELGVMVLDNIIRFRLQMKMPIWCTSNVGPRDIKTTYTQDLASMLNESCLPIKVTGEDYRAIIAEQLKEKYR